PAVTAGALAYMVISVLGIAAFFLLSGLIVPQNDAGDVDRLEPYNPTGDVLYADEDERLVTTPAPIVILGACFFVCALLLAGLPPLPGFLAKFALLAPMLDGGMGADVLFALIIGAGFCTVVAMCRAGIQIFWDDDTDWVFPHAGKAEVASVVILLGLCTVCTVFVAVPWDYLLATAQQIHAPGRYVGAVLSGAAVAP